MLWGFDSLSRFLLKSMKNPYFIPDLNGIDDSKRIAVPRQRNLKNAGTQTFERLGNIRFAALRGNGQSRETDRLRL